MKDTRMNFVRLLAVVTLGTSAFVPVAASTANAAFTTNSKGLLLT